MKKSFKILLLIIFIGLLTACCNKDAVKFKEDYESLNGQTNKNNKEYRNITIDENNPFVYSNLKEINNKIKKKETFIVYFGANWCPWCRSILPSAIKEAKANSVDKIYYIDVRPNNDENKDIRDIYSLDNNGKVYLSHEGMKAYHEFLKYADSVLKEYSSHGVDVKGVKRVGAPSFILVKNGIVTRLEEGVPSSLSDPYMKLTNEIITSTENIFDDLYKDFKNN